jgi:hypothetical protein
MISDGEMLALVPRDIRARLAGRGDSMALRKLAWLCVEDTGNPCPPQAFDAAVDRWLELDAPEPELRAVCPHCGGTVDELAGQGRWLCRDCDVVFGTSWGVREPHKLLWGRFDAGELAGNQPGWGERGVRWPVNSDPSDFELVRA